MREEPLPEREGRFPVPPEASGARLDRFLSEADGTLTRAAAVRLIEGGYVSVETKRRLPPLRKDARLCEGDVVTVRYPEPAPCAAEPEPIPLRVVYEDEDLIVVDKPAGMVVHPSAGHESGTLVNALLYHCGGRLSGVGGVRRPGIVHRLDRDTSGLLVAAANDAAHEALSAQLRDHTASRVYLALCVGSLREDEGIVRLPIGRSATDRKRMAAYPAGSETGDGSPVRAAATRYQVLERLFADTRESFTYARCALETGRTHQIRVHLAALGHPILGDPVYGGTGTRFGRSVAPFLHGQCLHAAELSLTHPRTGERLRFVSDLPPNFAHILNRLRKETLHD